MTDDVDIIGTSSRLVFLHRGDQQPFTTSLIIAERTDNQHQGVRELITNYLDDFQAFGPVRFETGKPLNSENGGGRPTKYAELNEEQAFLLISYMRNTPVVRELKQQLVRDFVLMRRVIAAAAASVQYPSTREQRIALALQESVEVLAERERQITEQREQIGMQSMHIAELEPKAELADNFITAKGSYSVKEMAILLNNEGFKTGQNRLFDVLMRAGWIRRSAENNRYMPYQSYVDRGWLRLEPRSHHHPRTGELLKDAPQVRIMPIAQDALRKVMREDQGVLKVVRTIESA